MTEVAAPRRRLPEARLPARLLSDDRLAQLTARGDERAFGLLYERHRGALYRYCRSIVRDEEDAQDALQSAFTRAFAALSGGERDLAVRPWLFRIVHNEAISLLRRRRPSDPLDEQDAARGSVEGTFEERERLAALVADLRTLGERQRAALVMRELSGLSIEEIAGALAITPGAAKQALFEARCALHELAQGRAMECETVRRTISERDGRVLRGRKLRAHLRACSDCGAFRALIDTRGADLRALVPPLPGAASLGLLARALDLGGGHAGEAAVGVAGASLGGPAAAASLLAKGLAGVALMTATTGVAAELAGEHGGGRAPAARPPAAHATPGVSAAPALPADRPHRAARRGEHGRPAVRERAVARSDAGARPGALLQPPAGRDAGAPPSAGREAGASAPSPAGRDAGAPPAAAPTPSHSRPTPAPASAPAAQASTTPTAPPAQAPASPGPGQHGPPSAPPGQAQRGAGTPPGQAFGPPSVPPGQAKQGASAPLLGLLPVHLPPGQAKRAEASPPSPSAPAGPPAAKPAPPGQQQQHAGPPSETGDGHAGNPHAGSPPHRGHR